MNCCLWFDRCKISSAAEIPEHLDIAALRGYFLGGSLVEWLREHDGGDYADKLERIDPKDPELNRRLTEIFGQTPAEPSEKEIFRGYHAAAAPSVSGSFTGGSFNGGSWYSSFGSFVLGSYRAGSFRMHEWEWEWSRGGSFTSGSYLTGSFGSYVSLFHMWEWEWEWRFGGSFTGSFRFGSYQFGSYRFGAGSYLLGSFNGFGSGSFCGSYAPGSFSGWQGMTAEEYDRIMYECLRRYPLDCFGYGIHIV